MAISREILDSLCRLRIRVQLGNIPDDGEVLGPPAGIFEAWMRSLEADDPAAPVSHVETIPAGYCWCPRCGQYTREARYWQNGKCTCGWIAVLWPVVPEYEEREP